MRHGKQADAAVEGRAELEPTQTRDAFARGREARILRLKQVVATVGLGKSSIYRKVQEGTFPAPIKLGGARASGWISTEVFEWIENQVQRSRM